MPAAIPRDAMRIAVFAKAPVAGSVKTRLAGVLGDEAAAALHCELVRRALATALESGVGDVELWCAPNMSHPFFASCAAEYPVQLRRQSGVDLGERMRRAFECAAAADHPLLLIGSDCPALDGRTLRTAASSLSSHDAVIVPAEDGGYVLVGIAGSPRGIFDGVAWGAPTVMAQTRARLEASGLRWCELDTLWDVDRPEDYARAQGLGLLGMVNA